MRTKYGPILWENVVGLLDFELCCLLLPTPLSSSTDEVKELEEVGLLLLTKIRQKLEKIAKNLHKIQCM